MILKVLIILTAKNLIEARRLSRRIFTRRLHATSTYATYLRVLTLLVSVDLFQNARE